MEWDIDMVSRNNCVKTELAGEIGLKCNGIKKRFHAGKSVQLIYGKYQAVFSD